MPQSKHVNFAPGEQAYLHDLQLKRGGQNNSVDFSRLDLLDEEHHQPLFDIDSSGQLPIISGTLDMASYLPPIE